MTQTVESERMQDHRRDEPESRPDTSEPGHTGEGAASAMAQLIRQREKRRRQGSESPDAS